MPPATPLHTPWLFWAGSGRVLVVCLALLLGACASTRVIDSEVRSFAGAVAPQAPTTYRFDRLPSQQSSQAPEPGFQDQLEAMTAIALAEVGLKPDAQQPRYLAQISASVEQIARAPVFPGLGLGGFWGLHHPPYGLGMAYSMEPPWTRYGVHILLRDAASGQSVFESTAQHVGPWSDTSRLLPAVVRAALRDYPKATPQVRTVHVEIGPQGLSERP